MAKQSPQANLPLTHSEIVWQKKDAEIAIISLFLRIKAMASVQSVTEAVRIIHGVLGLQMLSQDKLRNAISVEEVEHAKHVEAQGTDKLNNSERRFYGSTSNLFTL